MSKIERLRYVSDVHREINREYPVPPFIKGTESEALILDGDIVAAAALRREANDAKSRSIKKGTLQLLDQAASFGKVFWVMGNHEHYAGWFQRSAKIIRDFLTDNGFSKEQFIILDNGLHFLNDKTILVGATLWTDMGKDNPMSHMVVGQGMNDFKAITYTPGDSEFDFEIFTTKHAMAEHRKSREYIDAVCKEFPKHRIIVATHHAPSYQSKTRHHRGPDISDGYCSDMDNFILDRANITDWIHGHTHMNVEYHIGQCRITSNMQGYIGYDASAETFTREQFESKYIDI